MSTGYNYPTLILILSVSNCSSDIALNGFNIDVTNEIPKAWHGYIRLFFKIYLERSISFNILISRLLEILTYSKSFLRLRDLSIRVNSSNWNTKSVQNVTWASRHFTFEHGRCSSPCLDYYFELYYLLRLNFTFNIIHSPYTVLRLHESPSWYSSLRYVGFYSTFCIYPKFKNLHLKHFYLVARHGFHTTFHITGHFIINGSFTIFDYKLIHNYPVNSTGQINPNIMYRMKKYIMLSYFLHVRKLDQIFVQMELIADEYIIYDGPGIFTDKLKKQNYNKCSTFQCVVHVLREYNAVEAFLNYYSRPQAITEIKGITAGKNQLMHLPDKKCSDKACIIYISAEFGHHVNATINKVSTPGNYYPICMYKGLVAAEQLPNDYKQSETICKSHNEVITKHPSRSFYSYSSTLTLVLFWYKQYSTINVSVMISQTKCEPVEIDVCMYSDYCAALGPRLYPYVCDQYLKYITQYTKIKLLNGKVFRFIHTQSKCVVFILSNNKTISCHIKIYFVSSQMEAIRGLIKNSFFEIFQVINKCFSMNSPSLNCIRLSSEYKVPIIRRSWFTTHYNNVRIKFGVLSINGHVSSECKCWLEITLKQSNLQSGRIFAEQFLLAVCIADQNCHPQWDPFLSNSVALMLQIKDYTSNYSVLKYFLIKLIVYANDDTHTQGK